MFQVKLPTIGLTSVTLGSYFVLGDCGSSSLAIKAGPELASIHGLTIEIPTQMYPWKVSGPPGGFISSTNGDTTCIIDDTEILTTVWSTIEPAIGTFT